MALENEAPARGSSDKAYVLPSWFLEQNVKTAQDLATTPDQMVFCDCDDCEKTKLDEEPFEDGKQSDDKSDGMQEKDDLRNAPDDMHYKTFAELRDATCASFMPARNGKLRPDSTIVFRINENDANLLEPTWMSRAVVQMAKASKTISVISFDIETLEELGCEFHHQETEKAEEPSSTTTEWGPDVDSFTTFLEHFFAIRSKAKADEESWQRNQQILSTILDAAQLRSAARCAEMGETGAPDAVLIHIMDCSLVDQALGHRVKRRVFTRLAEMVRARREQGQAMSILLSTDWYECEPQYKMFNKIGATDGSTVTASGDKILDLDQRMSIRRGLINTQRMRRLMRLQVPSDFIRPEILDYSPDWAATDRGQTLESFGSSLWSSGDVRKVVARIAGRAWRIRKPRSQMTITDICSLLERAGLFYQAEADAVNQATEEQTEEAGEYPTNGSQSPKFPKPSNACDYAYR